MNPCTHNLHQRIASLERHAEEIVLHCAFNRCRHWPLTKAACSSGYRFVITTVCRYRTSPRPVTGSVFKLVSKYIAFVECKQSSLFTRAHCWFHSSGVWSQTTLSYQISLRLCTIIKITETLTITIKWRLYTSVEKRQKLCIHSYKQGCFLCDKGNAVVGLFCWSGKCKSKGIMVLIQRSKSQCYVRPHSLCYDDSRVACEDDAESTGSVTTTNPVRCRWME